MESTGHNELRKSSARAVELLQVFLLDRALTGVPNLFVRQSFYLCAFAPTRAQVLLIVRQRSYLCACFATCDK